MKVAPSPRRYPTPVLIALASLAACGGGDGDTAPAPAPAQAPAPDTVEGIYGGSLSGSPNPAFQLLVLPDGEYWSIYGRQNGAAFEVSGFIQGTGSATGGSFTSSNARDFGSFPATAGTIAATYKSAAKTITGTFNSSAPTVGFSGGPITGSLYNFNTPASLSTLTGTWVGANNVGEVVTLTIAASGSMTAVSSGGCVVSSANAAPSPSGRNVFALTVVQGPNCAYAGQTLTGLLISYPLPSGRTELLGAMKAADRTAGIAFFGTR